MPRDGSTHSRGYGAEHQKLRKRLIESGEVYGQPCWRCGEPMMPGQSLDLGHREDRSGYMGMEHSICNRSAGGRKNRGKPDVAIHVDNP